MKLGKQTRTPRGFPLVEFSDIYGAKCSLRASSLAWLAIPGTSAVWLGIDENNARMYLDRAKVKALIGHLQAWLASETGQFNGK
jgi:hypothetical protein